MKNKKVLAAVLLVLFLIGGTAVTSLIFSGNPISSDVEIVTTTTLKNDGENNPSEQVLSKEVLVFYTTSCPFCENLKTYIKDNSQNLDLEFNLLKIDDPVKDKANLELVLSKIKECNITDRWGVPFTYHNGKCVMGDQPAIEYFKQFSK